MIYRPYYVMEIAVYVINETIEKGNPINEATLQELLKQINKTFIRDKGIKCFNGSTILIDGEEMIPDIYDSFNRYTKRTIPYQDRYRTLVVDWDLTIRYEVRFYYNLELREEDKKIIDTIIDLYIYKQYKLRRK